MKGQSGAKLSFAHLLHHCPNHHHFLMNRTVHCRQRPATILSPTSVVVLSLVEQYCLKGMVTSRSLHTTVEKFWIVVDHMKTHLWEIRCIIYRFVSCCFCWFMVYKFVGSWLVYTRARHVNDSATNLSLRQLTRHSVPTHEDSNLSGCACLLFCGIIKTL